MLRPCLAATTLLIACTEEGERGSGTAASLTGITSASSPGTASAGPTTGTDATTAPGTDGAATDSTDTTVAGSGTSSGPLTGPGETGVAATDFDPPPTGEYAASHIPGEQNHLSVRKADLAGDWCATITFVAPQEMGPLEYEVMLPTTWRVKSALIHQGAADCLDFAGFPAEPIMALSGNGSATWTGACPATLGIDLVIAFPPEQPWAPPEVLLQAQDIAVSGC